MCACWISVTELCDTSTFSCWEIPSHLDNLRLYVHNYAKLVEFYVIYSLFKPELAKIACELCLCLYCFSN